MSNPETFKLMGETFEKRFLLRGIFMSLSVFFSVTFASTFIAFMVDNNFDLTDEGLFIILAIDFFIVGCLVLLLSRKKSRSENNLKLGCIGLSCWLASSVLVTIDAAYQSQLLVADIIRIGALISAVAYLYLSILFWWLQYKKSKSV